MVATGATAMDGEAAKIGGREREKEKTSTATNLSSISSIVTVATIDPIVHLSLPFRYASLSPARRPTVEPWLRLRGLAVEGER